MGGTLLLALSQTRQPKIGSSGEWRFDPVDVSASCGPVPGELRGASCRLRVVAADGEAAAGTPLVFEASFVAEQSSWDGRFCRFLGISSLADNPPVPVSGQPFFERFYITCRPLFQQTGGSAIGPELQNKLVLVISFDWKEIE